MASKCQKLSVAHFVRIKPRRNKMLVNKRSPAFHSQAPQRISDSSSHT
jgi:hypothetical protein